MATTALIGATAAPSAAGGSAYGTRQGLERRGLRLGLGGMRV